MPAIPAHADQWISKLLEYLDDPRKFVYELFNIENMELFQEEGLVALLAEDQRLLDQYKVTMPGKVSIASGHGVGKTALMAWANIIFMNTHKPCRVPCTAPSSHQLEDVLWPEISMWMKRLPPFLADQWEITNDKIYLKAAPDDCFSVARTARAEKPEALQGFHCENILVEVDEGSGVPDGIFVVAGGLMTGKNSRVLMASNPTRITGYFFDSHHKMRSFWHSMQVSCMESGQVSEQYIETQRRKWGEESNVWRVRVMGQFPTEESQSVIPLSLMQDAIDRDVEPIMDAPMVWGLDPARFGDDETALYKRKGNIMPEKGMAWRNKDTMQITGIVTALYKECLEQEKHHGWNVTPHEIVVDAIGVGAGVADGLRHNGLPVRAVNVSEQASNKDRFHRLRDELWFAGREWFESKIVKMVRDDELIAELSGIMYDFHPSGKIWVQGKQRRKQDKMSPLGFSPNRADAFLLTLITPDSARKRRKRLNYNNIGYV